MTAQQLKNSILQMAVQGKLVPQDPNDEPASVLLERIRAEKEQLIKQKKIKREKNPSVIFKGADNTPYEKIGTEVRSIADEIPFDIPETWEWVRCSSLGEIVRGSGIKRTETVPSGMPCVRYGELYTSYNIFFREAKSFIPAELDDKCKHFSYGDILMTLTGENKPDIAKAVAYLGNASVAAGGDLAYWTAHGMNPLYLVHVMSSPYVIARKVDLATGDIIVHISGDKIGSILIPIPPLEEQERIVQQIEELNSFITEYGNKEAALSELQISFPEQLKKSILQMAVQGKLVPQNATDEPASILLDRIRAEKDALIKVGKIKRDKHESVIFRRDNSHYEKRGSEEVCLDDTIPFEIPSTWSWCRLGAILQKLTDGTHSTPKYVEHGIPFISVKDVSAGVLTFSNAKHITKEEHSELYKRCDPKRGDILLTKVGTTGIPVIVDTDQEFSLFVSVALLRFSHDYIVPEYLLLLLKSPLVQMQCTENTRGVGNKNWVMRDIANTLISIPPLQEQHRIVEFYKHISPFVDAITTS